MQSFVMIIHVLAASAVIGLVLLQHGKGADMGAAFGSGASGSLFGVSGSANLLSRLTAASVFVFFCTSLSLAYMAGNQANGGAIKITAPVKAKDGDAKPAVATDKVPAAPASAAQDVPK